MSKSRLFLSLLGLWLVLPATLNVCRAEDRVFSGPQPGERTTPFKVLPHNPASESAERDPITEYNGAPTVLVFVHALERSIVPLLRVVDEYGAAKDDGLKTEMIFLSPDRITGEQRMKAAAGSLRLKSRVGLSLDGIEGPGNYGLNKECMMTIVLAKDNKVTANFALVQPGIADGPKVISAMAALRGDTDPPSAETLSQRTAGRGGAGRMEAPMREGMREGRNEPFPGAVPTDEALTSLLRQFIRPTNDDATVDRVLARTEAHIKDNPDLKRQAIDGWTRVLHFGDRYGTPYARKAGAEFLKKLQSQ